MPDSGNQGGRIMARVCDLLGHILVFLGLILLLNLALNLVPVLVQLYLFIIRPRDEAKQPFGRVRPRFSNQGGRINHKVVYLQYEI